MRIEEAIRHIEFCCKNCSMPIYVEAYRIALSALHAQQKMEEQCAECGGILYRQTNSGRVIPCDKTCAAKLQQLGE